MKFTLTTLGFLLSINAQAAIDYSYCQQALNPFETMGEGAMWGGGMNAEMKGYPYTLTADGKIKPHAKIKSFKEDAKARTETIVYGDKPFEQKVVILRDEAGIISKVISTSEYDAPQTKSGVGSKKQAFPGYGMGMGGFGYPGIGMGMPSQDSRTDIVTDLKIQNGKCMPFRSLMEIKTGKHLARHFLSDVQLCRDMKNFFKKNPEAEACFGSKFNAEVNEVMKGHHTRNADVYKPDADKQDKADPFGGYGIYPASEDGGFPPYDGGGFNSPGMSFNGMGGYGMFIDNLASQDSGYGQSTPLSRGHMIMQYCKMPFGPISKMIDDEGLFALESTEAAAKSSAVSK